MHDERARTLLEQSLVEIWSTTLGRSDIGLDQHFFEGGGDSLLAMATMEQINQRMGWKLSMGDMIAYPTIRELIAHRAVPQAASSDRAIVRMSRRGGYTPLVFIHPGSGMLSGYAKLVRHLGAGRGCYGLQSPVYLDQPGVALPGTIEDLAGVYADLIADELGEDEFHLVGSCVGGAIATEIARIAPERGLELQKLVVINTYLHEETPDDMGEEFLLRDFRADLMKSASAYDPDAPPQVVDDPAEVFEDLSAALFGESAQSHGSAAARFLDQVFRSYQLAYRALVQYRPGPGDISALLLLSHENDTLPVWQNILEGDLVAEVLGHEREGLYYDGEADELAKRISAYLGEV
jgi:thioesterase domain-containing protein